MKKSAVPAALLLLAIGSSGCPVYDSRDNGCYDDWDCRDGYVCDIHSGACVVDDGPVPPDTSTHTCNEPTDCGTNETCSRAGTCKVGDCHFESIGCVRGYECSKASGRWQCVSGGQGDAGADGGGSAGASAAGSAGESSASGGAAGG